MSESIEPQHDGLAERLESVEAKAPAEQLGAYEQILAELGSELDREDNN